MSGGGRVSLCGGEGVDVVMQVYGLEACAVPLPTCFTLENKLSHLSCYESL